MLQTEEFDLVVAGGGPGGTTLAAFVAMQNHRVLLLDRDKFPIYQIGESLLPATVHGICAMLGVRDQVERAGFMRKLGGTFRWGKNPNPWTFSFGASPSLKKATAYAYQVERSKFDHLLLRNARQKGVDIRENHTVRDVITEEGRVVGVIFTDEHGHLKTVRARFVADASGHQSLIARKVGNRLFSRFFQNIAVFGYYKNGKRLPPPNHGNILCAAFKDGWFWYIPLSEHLTSVGAVVGREQAKVLRGGREKAMEHWISECPIIKEYLASATRVTDGPYGQFRIRKDYSYCSARFWIPGMLLVGDAACFVDPVFSSGVHLATYSALLAARSINTLLSGELTEERCFREFTLRYQREFGNFYQFLLAFYDSNRDESSYFWTARKILKTKENANQAFVRLVAGVSTWGPSYGPCRNKLFSELVKLQRVGALGAARPTEEPLFKGGLISSRDGLRWQEKPRTTAKQFGRQARKPRRS